MSSFCTSFDIFYTHIHAHVTYTYNIVILSNLVFLKTFDSIAFRKASRDRDVNTIDCHFLHKTEY